MASRLIVRTNLLPQKRDQGEMVGNGEVIQKSY